MYLFPHFSLHPCGCVRGAVLGRRWPSPRSEGKVEREVTWEETREGKRHIGFLQGDTIAF